MTTVDTWISGYGLRIHAGSAWPGPGSAAMHRLIAAINDGRASGKYDASSARGTIDGGELKVILADINQVRLTVDDGDERLVEGRVAAQELDQGLNYSFSAVEF
jgi:hypothetical protein